MRLVTVADADELAELDMKLFPENCLNEHTLTREIGLGRGWCICKDERIVAYALCRGDEYLTDLMRLGVLPEHQRQGLASRLLATVVNCAEHVMLTVQPTNETALYLYHRRGFEIVGRLYDGAWVMERVSQTLFEHSYFIGLDL